MDVLKEIRSKFENDLKHCCGTKERTLLKRGGVGSAGRGVSVGAKDLKL